MVVFDHSLLCSEGAVAVGLLEQCVLVLAICVLSNHLFVVDKTSFNISHVVFVALHVVCGHNSSMRVDNSYSGMAHLGNVERGSDSSCCCVFHLCVHGFYV